MALGRIRWYSAGRVTNPTTGAVLADTGAIGNPEEYFLYVTARTSVAVELRVEHRNAANSATLFSTELDAPAGNTVQVMLPVEIFAEGERVRVVAVTGVTGNVTVAIALERRNPWMH